METGTTHITDTIIANYTVGISQTGGILSTDYDLFFTATPTQTSSGTMNWGSHNLNANPQLVNPAAGDYHLADGSLAIDTGTNAGVATDLVGVTRPQGIGYDIGAYEASLSSGPCYARLLSNSATYTSTNAAAVQAAVDAAPSGDTVKVVGTCAGVQARTGIAQTVYISKSLTVRGGYTTANWTTSDPVANLTLLDARQSGRVVYLTGGSGVNVTLENLTVRGGFNGYDNYGGGIYNNDARLTLSNTIVRDNSSLGGGGVFVNTASATLNVKGGQILSNTADGGGGVYLMYGSATLSGTQILNNIGGGLGNESGSATLSGTQILNNVDGGLFNYHGTLAVVNSTVSDNIADMYSGITNYGTLTITHSTISGNRGTGPVYGVGAIVQGGSATIVNCTIVSNTASNAAHSGIWLQGGTLTIQNSIVAQNGITNNVKVDGGTFTSLGYNLTNSGAGTPFSATNDLINTNPLVGPLQDNGGSSWTHALLPGSPAIDRVPFGVSGCGISVTTDQRGQPRPGTFTHLCDIGAYETQDIHYQIYLPLVIK
jgi:Ni,Fe-hydrogenase III small subunit